MVALLNKHIGNKATFTIPDGGLAFWIVPKKEIDWLLVSKTLESKSIKIMTPDAYSFNEGINGIRLGYGALSEIELEEGIIALSNLL